MSPQKYLFLFLLCICCVACNQADDPISSTDQVLRIKFKFDPTQERLDNFGNPAVIPSDHATQTPNFNTLSAHFIEFTKTRLTPYKGGVAIFNGAEVVANNPNSFGFTTAIDFEKAMVVGEEEWFVEIPIKDITPGDYEHLRISVSYQNYDIQFNLNNIPQVGNLTQQTGTLASFLGYNTFIESMMVDQLSMPVNESKLQGFWAFETQFGAPYTSFNQIYSGQAPANSTTVVNPFPDAPVPPGSCVVSGSFDNPLTITGEETRDISVILSLSINNSFEWVDTNGNERWDIDVANPENSEQVVDMGLRGLKAFQE